MSVYWPLLVVFANALKLGNKRLHQSELIIPGDAVADVRGWFCRSLVPNPIVLGLTVTERALERRPILLADRRTTADPAMSRPRFGFHATSRNDIARTDE